MAHITRFGRGYRTLVFNALALLVTLLEVVTMIASDGTAAALIPPEYLPHWTLFVILCNALLRFLTTTPVGGEPPPPDPKPGAPVHETRGDTRSDRRRVRRPDAPAPKGEAQRRRAGAGGGGEANSRQGHEGSQED